MPRGHRGRLLAGLGIVLGVSAAAGGCQTLPPTAAVAPAPTVRMAGPEPARPDPATVVLGPQTLVQWSAESTKDPAAAPVQGKAVVGPDGKVDLGPYGSVAVGGLTAQQASNALAKQLSRYIRGPHVHLTATLGPKELAQAARPGGTAKKTDVARAPLRPVAAPQGQSQPLTPASWQTDQAPPPPVPAAAWQASPTAGPELPAVASPAVLQVDAMPSGAAPTQRPDAAKPPESKDDADKTETAPAPTAVLTAPTVPVAMHHPGGHRAPNEMGKRALPAYVIEPPDILLIEYAGTALPEQPISGQHLVRPDGTVGLGIYGSAFVGGLTLEQAREIISAQLQTRIKKDYDIRLLNVDVLAYNSKVYYVITDGAGLGEQVYRFPVTGSETVLDAISQINGLPPVADKHKIWVARRVPGHGVGYNILPVDWVGITQHGATATNYQVLPGDRIYVKADAIRTADTFIAKVLSPIERILGATLLGSQTVNSIRSGGTGGSGSGVR